MTSLPFEKLLNQTHRPSQAGKTWPQTKLVAVGHCCKLTVDSSPNNQCKVIASLQPHLGHPVPHLLARLFHPLMVKSTISIAREGAFFLSPSSITARLPLRTTIDRSLSPVYLGSVTAAFSQTRPRTLWNKRWILCVAVDARGDLSLCICLLRTCWQEPQAQALRDISGYAERVLQSCQRACPRFVGRGPNSRGVV